jgi:hypothetical protein
MSGSPSNSTRRALTSRDVSTPVCCSHPTRTDRTVRRPSPSVPAAGAVDVAASVLVLNPTRINAILKGPQGLVAKDILRRTIRVTAQAKRLCPVATGRLRNSIRYTMLMTSAGPTGEVGSDVVYAGYVEEGTKFMMGRHFLREALSAANDAGKGA